MVSTRYTVPSALEAGETFRTPTGTVVFVHDTRTFPITYKGAVLPVTLVTGCNLSGGRVAITVPEGTEILARRARRDAVKA